MQDYMATLEDLIEDVCSSFATAEIPTLVWEHIECNEPSEDWFNDSTSRMIEVSNTSKQSRPDYQRFFEVQSERISALSAFSRLLQVVQADSILGNGEQPEPYTALMEILTRKILPAYCSEAGGVRLESIARDKVVEAVKLDIGATTNRACHLFPITQVRFSARLWPFLPHQAA